MTPQKLELPNVHRYSKVGYIDQLVRGLEIG